MERTDAKAATKRAALLLTTLATLAIPSFAQKAKADTALARRTVLVSIPDRKLAVIEAGQTLATFPVAVGAPVSPSPTGKFQIVSRVSHPAYYHAGAAAAAGKNNPIGTRWVGLSQKGYGIHGTNAPRSIGHAASHGCIRLRNRDMERLFPMLQVGDEVEIRGERDDEIAQVFGGQIEEEGVAEPDGMSGR